MSKSVLIRRISYGLIEGLRSEKTNTLCWLGVPYAAPPVGALRWRAPKPHENWNGVRPAKKLASMSLQKGKQGLIGSEDCLYLNIYRPETEEENLPVLFFIHGGNNQTDSGAMLDGEILAEGIHAVIVSINLRLNSLGWLNLPALKTGDPLEDSGNFGLLDILAALNFTIDNIGEFGGDVSNITACGYSSGGRDLLCMLISPLFAGKFVRAITFSGGFTTTNPDFGQKRAAKVIAALAVEDRKAENEEKAYEWLMSAEPEVREWLYSVSGERLAGLMAGAAIRMRVFPHLFADGVVIPKEGFKVLEKGKCNNVPMLCFSGGHEFDFPANNEPLFRTANFSDPAVEQEYRFATKYGGYLFGYINAEQNAEKFSAVNGHAPVYVARCMWGMNPEVTDEYAAMRMGGTHGLDIYMMMGKERADYGLTENVWSKKNKSGREAMQHIYWSYLSSFMRNSNPNTEGLPIWEPWSGNGCIMKIDANCDRAIVMMSSEVVKESKVFEELEKDRSIPEDRKKYILKNVLNGRFFSNHLDAFVEEKWPR